MHGQRMNRRSWINEQVYYDHVHTLEQMNLRDFCANFRIGQRGNLRNKICRDQKPNYVAIFFQVEVPHLKVTTTMNIVNSP